MWTEIKGLRRVAVAAVAAITIGGLVPIIGATSASAAGEGTQLTLSPTSQTGAAGTCLLYTISVNDQFGRPATDSGTVRVELEEDTASSTQDVDFCVVPGATSGFTERPNYDNAPEVPDAGTGPAATCTTPASTTPPMPPTPRPCTLSSKQEYTPGPSVTSPASNINNSGSGPGASTDNPDAAESAGPTNGTNANNNSNPAGIDRAAFRYGAIGTGTNTITFGVAGLTIGAAKIRAFLDLNNNGVREATGAVEPQVAGTATFTAGGRPGSPEAANAARTLTVTPDSSVRPSTAPTHTFQVTVRNANNNTLQGVVVSYIVQSGPGQTNTPVDCSSPTDNSGMTTCTFTAPSAGTSSLLFYVNQTTGSTSTTAGPDSNEPRTSATAITTPPPVGPERAKTIDLQPDSATTTGGTSRTFTAVVVDENGAPAQGVVVTFVETGPGRFQGTNDGDGTSVTSATTDSTGRASAIVDTTFNQTGTQNITATINNPSTTQCQTVGGRCSDTSTNTIVAGPAPSASPSASASASPSASASASPSVTPSATRPATTSPSASPSTSSAPACTVPASVSLDVTTITATGGANVTVRGTANSVVDLFAYSRPSSTYRLVRSGNVGSDGAETYRITPPTNTRLYAQQRGCTTDEPSASRVLNVRTQISLNVVRNGVRNYTFSGSLLPARPNGLIASLYRVESNGRQILTAQTRANANVGQAGYDPRRPAGSYSMTRQFTGSGRFGFVVRTGQDLQNAPGSSNVRSLAVF